MNSFRCLLTCLLLSPILVFQLPAQGDALDELLGEGAKEAKPKEPQGDLLSDLLGEEPEKAPNEFIVHEWGSISLIQGSDHAVLGGLTDDQGDLPPFIETWFKQPSRANLPMMIEKPILYFYTKEAIVANVKVQIPQGIPTQWYPAAKRFHPPNPGAGKPQPPMKNGLLEWNWIAVTPPDARNNLKPLNKHPWWPIAREPDSAILRVGGTEEKFLFYRGSSKFKPTLNVRYKDGFKLQATKPVKHVFTVLAQDQDKSPVITYRPRFSSDGESSPATPVADAAAAGKLLRKILQDEGLYEKEADGLVRIWQKDIFSKQGLRAMYLMEEDDLEEMLPLSIQPAPDAIERVMLVRIECLSPDHEERILGLIKQLGGDQFRERQKAEEALLQTGRIGQGLMRRVWEESDDPEIKVRLKRILRRVTPSRP